MRNLKRGLLLGGDPMNNRGDFMRPMGVLEAENEDGRLIYASDGQPMHGTGRGMTDDEFEDMTRKLGKGKHVSSTDPLKKAVVHALKEASKGTKVTLVRYHGRHEGKDVYSGHCMVAGKRGQAALRLGFFVVRL